MKKKHHRLNLFIEGNGGDNTMKNVVYNDLGLKDYQLVKDIQTELFENNILAKQNKKSTQNTLIVCEHPHTITVGKSGKNENLLYNEEFLKSRGVSLYHIDRGGDVTYHGPGQLVVYPIFDLETFNIGLRKYIDNLEEVMIRLVNMYNIKTRRNEGATGVWLGTEEERNIRKIGAIGVRSSKFITMHGFALNINTDLSYFSLINPCGFTDRGVTSIEKETGQKHDVEIVKQQVKQLFEEIFVTN